MKTNKVCVKCGCPIPDISFTPLCLWGDRYQYPAYQTPDNRGCYAEWVEWADRNINFESLEETMVSIDQWLENK
jgi:hypothetical protein